MPTVSIGANLYHKKTKSNRKSRLNRAGIVGATLLSFMIVSLIFSTAWLYADLTRDLPSLAYLPVLLEPPDGILLQPTRIYDRSGEHLLFSLQNPASVERGYLGLPEELHQDRRWQVSYTDRQEVKAYLPPEIIAATLAVYEPNYWTSPGFSIYGLVSGNSPTLSQRLVADLLLQDEPPGLRRNLRERLLAAQLIHVYGHAKVLEWYLNSTQYGPLIYGVDSAAQVYFGKPANELTLAQAALIAAVDHAPALNPLNSPIVAVERQTQTLRAMLEAGFISQAEFEQALSEKQIFMQPVLEAENPFHPFTQQVLEELYIRLGAERLERGGLVIRTTVDYDLQLQISCAASIQVARMEATQERVSEQVDCEAARLLPTLALNPQAEPGSLSAEVVVLDAQKGQVLALAGGGSSYGYRVGQSEHPAGSLITPFIYLTAFTRGMGPASLLWDIPLKMGEIGESNDLKFHGPVSLRTAFANDYWTPALRVLGQVGSESVWRISNQVGLSTDVKEIEDLLDSETQFGGVNTSLLEIGHAYSVFANRGILSGQVVENTNGDNGLQSIKPILVLEVVDTYGGSPISCQGQNINCSIESRPVVSPQLSYLVTDILSDETARWPSLGHPNPLEIGRPAGAKVGRVDRGEQGWAAGYTPQIVAVTWFGRQASTQETFPDTFAANSASALWHAVIQYANRDLTPESWIMPSGISRLEVCYPSGLLPTQNCPTVTSEIFLQGNEPTGFDNLHREFQANRETGQLATIFTPPELIESQVYLVVPPDASEWARVSGLPAPPDTYDAIPAQLTIDADANITSPLMYSHVTGKVSITGTARGSGFDYYRIQVGKGLNPRHWLQIGDDSRVPVRNGKLAEWDVEGLSGLYAVQLQVVMENQEVKTSIIQVTVDNNPPDVSITRPYDKQRFTSEQDQNIILQVQAQDDLTLHKVEFYIDGRLLSTLMEPPYTLSWSAVSGVHSLLVKAQDLAQNVSEASLEFTIDR